MVFLCHNNNDYANKIDLTPIGSWFFKKGDELVKRGHLLHARGADNIVSECVTDLANDTV
jgi:hypothetical protein